ncbi:MAG: hypothetical protein KW793_02240 [Candidatus Doudnabacteria bacterium]|nr:hypothetical protein [Candidatus Doudnabacteria bacterium]
MAMHLTVRKIFLYIFASVGLVLSIIGSVSLINLGLKTYIFTKADNYCYERSMPLMKDPNGTNMTEEESKKQEAENNRICEEQRAATKQSQASNAISMLIVGLPLFFYLWGIIRADREI